jgi:hypothetical protein
MESGQCGDSIGPTEERDGSGYGLMTSAADDLAGGCLTF